MTLSSLPDLNDLLNNAAIPQPPAVTEAPQSCSIELVDHMGSDLRIVQAARVSLNRETDWVYTLFCEWCGASFTEQELAELPDQHAICTQSPNPEQFPYCKLKNLFSLDDKDLKVLRSLLRNKHACYDSETEVLTIDGWKPWPDVTMNDQLATKTLDGCIDYCYPERIVHEPYTGNMVRVANAQSVDLLVTPNHRVYADRRISGGFSDPSLFDVTELFDRPVRIHMSGGAWRRNGGRPEWGALLGFLIGDGCFTGTSIDFHLRRERKIEYLKSIVAEAGFDLSIRDHDCYRVTAADPEFRRLAKSCYDESGEKQIPTEILTSWGRNALERLFDGLLQSDGSVTETGKQLYSTTSYRLAGQLQDLMLKLGRAATVNPWGGKSASGFTDNAKPVWRVSLYRERNLDPRIGWTRRERQQHVSMQPYDGLVHCATVPSGVLYVRRNGKPLWCGNSPFEHVTFTFRVHCPMKVLWEWVRHRTQSYNVVSSRYSVIEPVFFVPRGERMRTQVGKAMSYEYAPLAEPFGEIASAMMLDTYALIYERYEQLLEMGVAKEVASYLLPFGTMTSFYVTLNLRNLWNFMVLRAAEDALAEIRDCALGMERLAQPIVPEAWGSWVKNGRPQL